MNHDNSSSLLDLQGLRLIRAFLRIEGETRRNEIIEFTERLAEHASGGSTPLSESVSSPSPDLPS